MSQKIKQSFGQGNLKYLGYWTGIFFFYRFFLDVPIITLICLIAILIITINLIQQITTSSNKEQNNELQKKQKQKMLIKLLHTWSNNLLNTLSRIFRSSSLLQVAFVVGSLYLLSKLTFICQNSTFIYLAGCILLLAPGFNRLLGGSLVDVEKATSISRIVKSDSLSSK